MTTVESPHVGTPASRSATTRTRNAPVRLHVVGAVFGRNFLGYFSNPAGYVFITLFVLVCSWFEFWQPLFFSRNLADLEPLNQWMPYILLFFVPAITMSVWADERRQGTDELLLTLPARDVEIVLGKYVAAVGIFTVSLVFLGLGQLIVLSFLGRPDWGVLASTVLGYWLMGAMLIAFGMVASALTSSVTVGFILGALFCAVPVFAGGFGPLGQLVGSLARVRGMGWLAPLQGADNISRVFENLSVPIQFRDFGTGVVPLSGVFYFIALSLAMLYLNMVLLGRRHWAGGQSSFGRWANALTRVAAVAVALVSLAVLLGRWFNVRVDATEERLHTLSPVTRQLVREIPSDRPVYIEAYVSPTVPREFVEAKTNLVNTLKELAALGGSRVRLNIVETKRFSPEAREAEKRYGITSRRVSTLRDNRQDVEDIYLGVAFSSGLQQVVVPFFDRGLPAEYELTRSLRVVSGTKRKRVGILDTDAHILGRIDFRTMGTEPEWEIVSELKKQYDVTPVSADTPIALEEVQTLSISGIPTSGTFTLTVGEEATEPLPFNAASLAVREAIEKLAKIPPGDVKVDGGPLPKDPIRLTFGGQFLGKTAPQVIANGELKAGETERPTVRVGKTTEVLDALIVPQATSLTQRQVDNLTAFVRQGGPTLLLLDPYPVSNPLLAPSEPRLPDQAMMMGRPSEPKGDLRPLLDLLGLQWPSDEIVWNDYNPHKQLRVSPEIVFLTREGRHNRFAEDPIVTKLQEVVLLASGTLGSREMPGDPRLSPLLSTDSQGGIVRYSELFDREAMFRGQPRRPPRYIPSGRAYTVAARIEGKTRLAEPSPAAGDASPSPPGRPVHAIVIADLDLISDQFFQLRRRPVEGFDIFNFDNVTFVLNCVDTLSGDETFLELRKKRPQFRTLTRLELASSKYEERAQDELKRAEDDARVQLDEAKNRLAEAVDGIRKSTEYDERTKESMVRYREKVEQDRLKVKEAEIEGKKNQAIADSVADQEQSIAGLQGMVRLAAIALPPLPALLLGAIVYGIRSRRENLGANPERMA
jgi:ABC-type uncharacterized transport system involved in gliding motility auxiliary subunit/ABC-type transport system involved in multi-copper enzyme maturation permease subunit